MYKGLFIFADSPLASNYSGAASRAYQNFLALSELCEELHVLRLCSPDRYSELLEFEKSSLESQRAKRKATSWQDVELDMQSSWRSYLQIFFESLFIPVKFQFPNLDANSKRLKEKTAALAPDFLWVEHSDPAALIQNLDLNIPWVYSHHDILQRVRQIRYPVRNLRDQWFLWSCERVEKQIDRASTAVITASAVEAKWLKKVRRGAESEDVFLIPMAYQGDPILNVVPSPDKVRIVHLGSLETTANRVGLTGYLDKVHKRIMEALCEADISSELWVIGDTRRVKPHLMDSLKKSEAVLTGYVADLESVLRPYDIAILPYEFDSGFRTKLPLFFRFCQVVVTTRKAVAGTDLDGLEDVCILTDSVTDFVPAIHDLIQDYEKRKQLAHKAASFYQKNFRFDAVLPLYRQILKLM